MASAVSATNSQVLIVDDHPVMRGGLASLLEAESGLEVVAEAGTVKDAMDLIERLQPDLVLADLRLPDGNGIELIKEARARWPKLLFLVISMQDEQIYAERVLRAGGSGYVMKEEAPDRLLEAVRKVLAGQIHLSDELAKVVIGVGLRSPRQTEGAAGSPMKALTDRELQVFELLGGGLATRAIAQHLSVSVKTVESHCANMKAKFDLGSRSELNGFAVRWYSEQS